MVVGGGCLEGGVKVGWRRRRSVVGIGGLRSRRILYGSREGGIFHESGG